MEVSGTVAAGFEPVGRAFEVNFAERGDVGAACCVYVDGRPVVDIWAGVADHRTGRLWTEDTTALVYSTTKGVTSICAHHLAERGRLDLDAPVATYWPEFAAAGKEAVTVRQLMCHQAGLPTLEPRLPAEEALAWQPAVDRLAGQAPLWLPGSRHGYHAVTFGWLVGEVIRRVSGRTVGGYLAEEIAGPLGVDFWIGLPESEHARVARLLPPPPMSRDEIEALPAGELDRLRAMADTESLTQRALNPTEPPFSFNSSNVRRAELPGANGIGTARALARMYAATIGPVDGVRLLSDDTVASATVVQSNGPDAVIGMDTCFGSGFMLASSFAPLMGGRSFGHPGAGGSLALADPDRGVAFAYVMNQMHQGLRGDSRAAALVRAVTAAIDKVK